MYVAIRRPRAYHACAHAQIFGWYTCKDRHNADGRASDSSTGDCECDYMLFQWIAVVGVNALLSAHAIQEEKRRYGLSQS